MPNIDEADHGEALEPTSDHGRVSRGSIIDALRGQIVQGQLSSGARLPNRRDLVRRFGASSVTIQRAVDQLVADGFIYTDGPNGTFVARHPPHISRYGLLLTSHPSNPQIWRRFSSVLCHAARDLYPTDERTIAIYYNIDGKCQSEDYHRLLADLGTQRLAGLIIAGDPERLFGTPVMEAASLPRVALMEEPAGPGIPVVGHDRYSFIDKALDYLRSRGRRHVAFIGGECIAPSNLQQYFASSLERHGMRHEPYWWQRVFVGAPELARQLAHLMVHSGQQTRPDGIIVYDDNLLEQVIAGLMDGGVQVPNDVDLVTHCNFPWTFPTVVSLKRIGYDACQTLRLCVELLDRQRRGEAVELMSQVKPVEEHQLRPSVMEQQRSAVVV